MDKKAIVIENNDGTSIQASLVTYLLSEDQQSQYVVYSKGELSGEEGDEVIYISKLARNGSDIYVEEITDESEWANVLLLLKKIANA